MIGVLPTTVMLGDKEFPINTDFRVALTIFEAFNDSELNGREQAYVMLSCFYGDSYEDIPQEYLQEAVEKASLFLDGGNKFKGKEHNKPIINWEQDEQMIFSAVNKVAGKELREMEYCHWWTFLSYLQEVDERCLFSTVVQLRRKRQKGLKLEKHEEEFYRSHKDMVDLKKVYSYEEMQEIRAINKLMGAE